MIPIKYIKENRDTHEIKTSTYILMIVMTIILVLALASKCHAYSENSQEYREQLMIQGSSTYCDWWFGELWFQEVPSTIEHECRPRFSFNVAQINRAFIRNSK